MVKQRKLEVVTHDCLCRWCGWPCRYIAISVIQNRTPRVFQLCELHGRAFAHRWNVVLPNVPR